MNLKFDYVLTIRYDDSHSDYSMLCSSEMNEWCFFVQGFDHVLFIRRDDGLSDHNSLRFILILLLFQNAMYFISPIV